MVVPIVSVVGRSNVGKTTFLVKVIQELVSRGYKPAVIKHDSHGFDIDHPGKDSWRLTQAGSSVVALSSAHKVAMIRSVSQEMSLSELGYMVTDGVDIILTEGYKAADTPKIEVFRSGVSDKILCEDKELVALVTDKHFDMAVPQFAHDDVEGVVNLVIDRFLGHREEDIYLLVNGEDIGLKPFVKDIFIKAISGMVAALHGTEGARDIKIGMHLP